MGSCFIFSGLDFFFFSSRRETFTCPWDSVFYENRCPVLPHPLMRDLTYLYAYACGSNKLLVTTLGV